MFFLGVVSIHIPRPIVEPGKVIFYVFTYYSGHKAVLPRKILNENSYINRPLISVGIVLGTLLDISWLVDICYDQSVHLGLPCSFRAWPWPWCSYDVPWTSSQVQFLCMLLSDMGIGDLTQKTWSLCLPCCFPAVWHWATRYRLWASAVSSMKWARNNTLPGWLWRSISVTCWRGAGNTTHCKL